MAKEQYGRYGISKERYLELKYIARQYDDYVKGRRDAQRAQKIEAAARAANSDLYPWIVENVTKGRSYEKLNPPCGVVQFYRARVRFFTELNALID